MRTWVKILLGVLAGGMVIFLALQTPILRRVRGVAWDVWVGSVGKIFQVGQLQVVNDTQAQLETLRSENTRLTADLRRYQRLEKQLGSASFTGFRVIPALVAARPIDTFSSEYVLDKGTADGLTPGAPVLVYGSTLVGFITNLSQHSSVATLLLNPTSALSAEILGDDPAEPSSRGLVQGSHFTGVVVTTVPRDQKLSRGMRAVTAIQERAVPAGLVLGNVDQVFSTESDAYQSASLTLPYDPGGLEAVTVLVPLVPRP